MKASVLKRIEELEAKLKSPVSELPPLDFDVLTECEKEFFSLWMRVLRLEARELGYGDKNNNVSWFDLRGCDPVNDEDIRDECLAALNAEEMKVIETFHEVIGKGIRLTAVLSDEEKADVKRYNEIARRVRGLVAKELKVDSCVKEELDQARQRYEEIMVEHGEEIYE